MKKEGLSPYQAYEKRIDFIEQAAGEGVLDKIPVSERDQNIALVYTLNDELTGEGVGKIFPKPSGESLTRARVDQVSQNFLRTTWNYASPQLQAFHPLEELLTRKPNTLGETASRVKSMAEEGNDPQQIKDTLGISTENLVYQRIVLRRRGIDVPRIRKSYQETFETIEGEEDDEKLQVFLDSFSVGSLIYFRQRDSSHETLTTASTIANKKGFHAYTKRVRFIAVTIKEAKIPIRQTVRLGKNGKRLGSYYIVYSKHEDRIAEVLRNDPALQRFR